MLTRSASNGKGYAKNCDNVSININMNIIPTPDALALQISELIGPFIGMIAILIVSFMFKDFAMKFAKGIAFSMNSQFKEGDHVLLDGERALIVKIGMTQTVFGINKDSGDYCWRYVPNERINSLKLEKVIFNLKPEINSHQISKNSEEIQDLKDKS